MPQPAPKTLYVKLWSLCDKDLPCVKCYCYQKIIIVDKITITMATSHSQTRFILVPMQLEKWSDRPWQNLNWELREQMLTRQLSLRWWWSFELVSKMSFCKRSLLVRNPCFNIGFVACNFNWQSYKRYTTVINHSSRVML